MKKLLIIPQNNDKESFEVNFKRVSNGVNDYLVDDKYWRAFQFDCRDRPNDYIKEYLKEVKFHGFLISKTIKGKIETLECCIRIVE